MAIDQLIEWYDHCSGAGRIWYLKRLSGNDTLANETHQAGPYIPKNLLFNVFPELNQPEAQNPDVRVMAHIDSNDDQREIRIVWYNKKTRNETRMTNLGGRASALLDPENTGALAIFCFRRADPDLSAECRIWVCRDVEEEDFIEDRLGPVEPGYGFVHIPHSGTVDIRPDLLVKHRTSCWLDVEQFPAGWLEDFPTVQELFDKALELRPGKGFSTDQRLLRRRDCEYQLFQSLEEVHELPVIKKGYRDVNTFLAHAQKILQRRKSRAGKSLELHVRRILIEEGLREGRDFAYQQVTEQGKRPDFLFPSNRVYQDSSFPSDKLRMLAVKTTCKDRWRQVLNEADRIQRIHLLTLQEGVSKRQFQEMSDEGVQLVVPEQVRGKFKKKIQQDILTLRDFIKEVKSLGTQ